MNGTEELYAIFRKSNGVVTDTRLIREGEIFFALRGDRFDGNRYALEALEKGAAIAVVDDPALESQAGCLLVGDTLIALQQLASYHRKQLALPVIGITGSNGKTTTKELVVRVLSTKYRVGYTRGNLNNHIGVPLTLLSFDETTGLGVVEMGANHTGEIAALCRIADPDSGLITNIGKAHLEGFGSEEGVFHAKTELLRYLEGKQGLFYRNAQDAWLSKTQPDTKEFVFGSERDLDVWGQLELESPELTVLWGNKTAGDRRIACRISGAYNLENILAAVSVGLVHGVDPEKINAAIASYQPDNNRSQMLDTGRNRILLDAYNANPSSMAAALPGFASIETDSPRMLILGDMFELGTMSLAEHQAVVDRVAGLGFDRVWLVGKEFSQCRVPKGMLQLPSTEEALRKASLECIKGWFILVKGSRGMHLEDIITEL